MNDNNETCDHIDCDVSLENDDVQVHVSGNGRFCCHNHVFADANGWRFEDMDEYDVEHDGIEGTYAAPSQEQADKQWRSKHWQVE